jgi:hypothetical protein
VDPHGNALQHGNDKQHPPPTSVMSELVFITIFVFPQENYVIFIQQNLVWEDGLKQIY